jgi:hypothetical protein
MTDLRILDWRPRAKNSLVRFAKFELPSGLIISDVTVLNGSHGPWAPPSSKPIINRDGVVLKDDNRKVRYVPIIEFTSKEIRSRASDAVIEALPQSHPDALAGAA